MSTPDVVQVGMGEFRAIRGDGYLKTAGLGSCIGLTLYDPVEKAAGMAHVMLPDSSIARENPLNKAKYADTAVPALLMSLLRIGAQQNHIVAKMAGGAQMFLFDTQPDTIRIGARNADACKQALIMLGIPLAAEDIGGNYGRTIEFNLETGMMAVRSVNQAIKEI